MPKTIYFTRHAQAEHNVAEDYSSPSASLSPLSPPSRLTLPSCSVPDAPLTKLGREQSRNLREETEDDFQKDAQLIVSSPVRLALPPLCLLPYAR